jgi:hypothetical protein
MSLTEYAKACIAKADTKTPKSVTIDKALILPLRNLRGLSESKVLEHGHNLFWKKDQLELSDRLVGQSTMIDLKSSEAVKDDAYIGDIHSHPYKIKMGSGARIGPSADDLDSWYKFKPAKLPLGVHLVMSSASVFLVVTRQGTAKKIDFSSAEPDTERLNTYAYTIPELAKGLEKARDKKGKERWLFEKQVWETMAPEAAAQFAEDNRKMNIAVANKSKHEFYYCEDIEKKAELVLLSKAVH